MTRPGRLAAVASVLLGALLLVPASYASHCPDQPYPDPPGTEDLPCPSQDPDPPDDEPEPPTPTPTPAPTAAPTPPPPAPASRPPPVTRSTPAPTSGTIDDVEVPSPEPTSSIEITVGGPIADEGPLDVAEPTASASSWIFGFIVGLLIGGFIGRASWGLRRRRRQQIFG